MDAEARRDLACRSAVAVAHRFDVGVEEVSIIKDSNNTIVGLNHDVVAKVSTTTLAARDTALDRELAVLQHLDTQPAPVGRLSRLVPRLVHEALGCRMLLLDRLERSSDVLQPEVVLTALAETHAAFGGLADTELLSFLDDLARAAAIFGDPQLSPTLPSAERHFCRRVGNELGGWFDDGDWSSIVLHGDPWLNGNLIATTAGPRLIDFEAVCVGPKEWDLSALGDLADRAAGIDHELLDHCRALRSYTVAAWCWAQPGRAIDVDEAAHLHLQRLHQRFD